MFIFKKNPEIQSISFTISLIHSFHFCNTSSQCEQIVQTKIFNDTLKHLKEVSRLKLKQN